MSGMPPYLVASVGCMDPIEDSNSESILRDDFLLFDSVEMEDLYIGLVNFSSSLFPSEFRLIDVLSRPN